MISKYCGSRQAIAFDPSYISKSGKQTPGVGYFWSGCAGKSKWGLEICGIAALDLDNHTAMHLEAVQTFQQKDKTLLEIYAEMLTTRKEDLINISDTIVCDAYFSKKTFIDALLKVNLQVVSRFRDDVRLKYIIPSRQRVKTGKRGRPQVYDGNVDYSNLNPKYFKTLSENDKCKVMSATVRAVALKREVKVVIVQQINNGEVKSHKIYFSTNVKLDANEILEMYQMRFQIEFIYRDAKQATGLNNCQARSKNKMKFHLNMSLTAINVAKVKHWYSIPKENRAEFSIIDIKTMNHNTLLLEKFISTLGIKPYLLKNNQDVKELILYCTKAA